MKEFQVTPDGISMEATDAEVFAITMNENEVADGCHREARRIRRYVGLFGQGLPQIAIGLLIHAADVSDALGRRSRECAKMIDSAAKMAEQIRGKA